MEMQNLAEATHDRGVRLSETSIKAGGWKEWFTEEDGSPTPISKSNRALTAYLLEMERLFSEGKVPSASGASWHSAWLGEDTRVANIGSFEKYVFPIIRAVFPNLVATELVSVQPMQGPTSLIFYMDFKAGSKKGTVNVGDVVISSRTGQQASTSYSGEDIVNESAGTGTGASTFAGQLAYFPLRPLSVTIVIGDGDADDQTFTDDGNGILAANASGTGTVNYATGEFTLATIVTDNQSDPILATYRYASEGSLQVPQIDVTVTSIPVTARPRKLRARWSVEGAAQLRAVHGTDAETEVTTAMAEEIRFDIDREIIGDLLVLAATQDTDPTDATKEQFTFYTTAPSGVSFFEHKMTIVDTFINHSNAIFQATKRAVGNWIVLGTNAASIVESLPMFKAQTVTGSGVVYMGDLQGRWRVYKDPYLPDIKIGSTTYSGQDRFLVGHRGTSYLDTGYIYAPWIPLYTTPTVYLDDFVGRKGLLTEYAKKPVNALFYSQGLVVHGAQP
jgi:hypothetical protein